MLEHSPMAENDGAKCYFEMVYSINIAVHRLYDPPKKMIRKNHGKIKEQHVYESSQKPIRQQRPPQAPT